MTMRLNLRISGPAEELLQQMADKLEVPAKEVILDALGLYHLALDEISRGNLVGTRDKDSGEFMAIVTPSLRRWTDMAEKQDNPDVGLKYAD